MEKYLKELRKNIRVYKKQLETISTKLQILEEMKEHLSAEQYEQELKKLIEEKDALTRSITIDKEKIAKTKAVDHYFENLENLMKLYKETNDPAYRKVIREEIQERRNSLTELEQELPEESKKAIVELYNTIENGEDKELAKFQRQKEILEEIVKESYDKKAKIIEKVRETYEIERLAKSKNSLLANYRKMADDELNNVDEEINNFKKYIDILDKKAYERAKIVKEAKAVNMSTEEYEKLISNSYEEKTLSESFKELGLHNLAKSFEGKENVSDKQVKDYKKQIQKYLKDKQKETTGAKTISKEEPVEVEPANVSATPKKENEDHSKENIENKINALNDDHAKEDIENKINDLNNKNRNDQEKTTEESSYGYKTIINRLVEGLDPKKKDGTRYRIANIKMKDSFKQELKSGNYLYNIAHLVPALIKVPILGVRKLVNKFFYRKDAKERMITIKQRLDKLPEKDLEILLNEYKNHIEVERYGTGLNMLINERLQKYVNEKVAKINTRLEANYKDIFAAMSEIEIADEKARDKSLSDDLRYAYIQRKKELFKGRAKQVAAIRKDYNDAKDLLSSGIHGFSENVKATESKMNYVGFRFAKEYDLDKELLKKEAELEKAESVAIATGNDEMALRVFVEQEKLLSDNTEIRRSIFGYRSTGKKYYSPLAEALDYRQDPFIRDVFTTVAVVSAAISATNALNAEKVLKEKQAEIDRVNANNEKVMDATHKAGEMIDGNRGTLEEGMKAQNYQDSLNISNILERKALDQSSEVHGGWSVGTNTYYNARSAAQNTYTSFFENTKKSIADITYQYSNGTMTQSQALEALNTLSKNSQSTLAQVSQDSLPHLINYANNHSQFDLAGVREAMEYVVANPNAISNMNNAMIEVTELGGDLQRLSMEQVSALSTLPENMKAPLISAAASTALALQVSQKVNDKARKGYYGNSVTELVEKYFEKQQQKVYKRK